MNGEELQQVKELVLRDLPKVLEQDPGFAIFIEGLLSEKFPRRDEFARLLDELEASRMENRERFEQVDQRFEQVNRRFEQVDRRFEQVDQRFDRLEKKLDQSVAELRGEIRGLKDWMELNVGGFQTKAGRRLEDVVAGAFCYGLQRSDIRPEQVKLRQKVADTEGVVFRPGKIREVDLIAIGDEVLVFEVKATADADDIDDLADKVHLMRHLHPGKKVNGILVMLGAERDQRELCARLGLTLIP